MPGFNIFLCECAQFEHFTFWEDKIAVRLPVPVVFQTRQLGIVCKRFHAVKLSKTIVMLRLVQLKEICQGELWRRHLNPGRSHLCSIGWTCLEHKTLSVFSSKSSSEYSGRFFLRRFTTPDDYIITLWNFLEGYCNRAQGSRIDVKLQCETWKIISDNSFYHWLILFLHVVLHCSLSNLFSITSQINIALLVALGSANLKFLY